MTTKFGRSAPGTVWVRMSVLCACGTVTALLATASVVSLRSGAESQRSQASRNTKRDLPCYYKPSAAMLDRLRSHGLLPKVAPDVAVSRGAQRGGSCIRPEQFFQFEESTGTLVDPNSVAQIIPAMVDGANALTAAHGDVFDFVAFFTSFPQTSPVGAVYIGVQNDVQGIGQSQFNLNSSFGLSGQNIQGLIMMWDVEPWPVDDIVLLFLSHEFEHRFGLFLSSLLDGRLMQGDNANCGRGAHWNHRIDAQGSCMELFDWIGANPATPGGDCPVPGLDFMCRNADTGGMYSYLDLYLMGYASAAEVDAASSELRYMDNANCDTTYNGAISALTSADIIAANGVRVPSAATSQKDFRIGWVMAHMPGQPPSAAQLQKAADIVTLWQDEFSFSTLGRGTLDNTIFADCNCNGVPDADDIAGGEPDANGNGVPDACEQVADIDGDGDVDFDDIVAFLACMNGPELTPPGGCDSSDLDQDGDVDAGDLGLLMSAYAV